MISFRLFPAGGPTELLANLRQYGHGEGAFREGRATMTRGTWDDWAPSIGERAGELSTSILFLTRLPLPRHTPIGGVAVGQSVWAFPVAGVVVGLIGALVYAIAHRLGLPPWPAAGLAVAATIAATGCLHEDGLADTADGFGGGDTTERKLDIMRDRRVGASGVCALPL